MSEKPASIKVLFSWEQVVPDTRPYKPSAPVLYPEGLKVTVDLPLKHEYIDNCEAIIQAQLGGGKSSDPILTPSGMRYCIDVLENAMSNPEEEPTGETETESWGDENWTETETETSSSDESDEWGDDESSESEDGWGDDEEEEPSSDNKVEEDFGFDNGDEEYQPPF